MSSNGDKKEREGGPIKRIFFVSVNVVSLSPSLWFTRIGIFGLVERTQ